MIERLYQWFSQPVQWTWIKVPWRRFMGWMYGDDLMRRELHEAMIHVHPNNEITVRDGDHWEVTFAPSGVNSRVVMGGVDVSDHIHSAMVVTRVGEITRLTLEGYCLHGENS